MRRRRSTSVPLIILVFLILVVSAPGSTWGLDVDIPNPRTLRFPPVEFTPPEAERVVLSNGMTVYLLEDHELPIITISVMFRAGSLYEPADKIGLAGLTGTVMRTGGIASRPGPATGMTMTGDQLDEALEEIAARLDVGIGQEAGSAGLDVLSKDLDRGLALLAAVLREPAFAEEKLDLAKKQTIEGIRRRNDNPGGIAGREFAKLLYGSDHPYAREATIETVTRITRQDLIAYHARYLHPNTMMFAIAGDFTKRAMLRDLARVFGNWKAVPVELPLVPPVPTTAKATVNYVERDITQAHLRLGLLTVKQDHPDYFALSVMNDILGGGFKGRMFREVRTREGLAYSVGTAFSPGRLDLGTFFAYAQTRAEAALRAIRELQAQLKRIREEPVTDGELQAAKDAFLNAFVFSFSSPGQIAGRQMSLEYYGLPKDFLERYRREVTKVTKEDILRVARTHLRTETLTLLVVGKQAKFDQPLDRLGPVHSIAIDDPPVRRE